MAMLKFANEFALFGAVVGDVTASCSFKGVGLMHVSFGKTKSRAR